MWSGPLNDDTVARDAGSAYFFDAASGNLLRTLSNPTVATSERFGFSVAVSGSTIVVGSLQDNDTGTTDAGSRPTCSTPPSGNLVWTLTNPTPASGD